MNSLKIKKEIKKAYKIEEKTSRYNELDLIKEKIM